MGGAGVDLFVYAAADWGYDQIFDFSRAEGDRLDFRGSGLSFASLTRFELGGSTGILFGDSRIDLYGVIGLAESDFLFG